MVEAHQRLIRQAARAFDERDVDAVVSSMHSEAEVELIGGFGSVMGQSFQGEEGVRRFCQEWFTAFKTMTVEVERFLDAGERILIFTEAKATGAESDVRVELLGRRRLQLQGQQDRQKRLHYHPRAGPRSCRANGAAYDVAPGRATVPSALKCSACLTPRLSPLRRIPAPCATSSESCATATRGTTASCACDRRTRRSPVSRISRLPATRSPWCSRGSGSLSDDRKRAPGRGASPPPARQARAADRVGRAGATRRRARRSSTRLPSGRIDHYVLRPSAPPDELFHHAISGLLLEWAEARRTSPYTIYVVGESWSGRAYELREALGRCAMPHSFCLADSDDGRALRRQGGRREQSSRSSSFPTARSWRTPATPSSRGRPARRSTRSGWSSTS